MGFRASGERLVEIRKRWRLLCLRYHPDKQPSGLSEENQVPHLHDFGVRESTILQANRLRSSSVPCQPAVNHMWSCV